MHFNSLIIGGGAAGLSCALVLGSAKNKPYAVDKNVGIITHQKTSHLQNALLNNVLGLQPGTLGKDILNTGKAQLTSLYPHVIQIENEKVSAIQPQDNAIYKVSTTKNKYTATHVIIAVGYTNLLTIKGLEAYVAPHPRAAAEKQRIWLTNVDHKITEGLYVAGTLAGWRSQYAIACGSGAQVATDILTLWNHGKHTKVHDKVG